MKSTVNIRLEEHLLTLLLASEEIAEEVGGAALGRREEGVDLDLDDPVDLDLGLHLGLKLLDRDSRLLLRD